MERTKKQQRGRQQLTQRKRIDSLTVIQRYVLLPTASLTRFVDLRLYRRTHKLQHV